MNLKSFLHTSIARNYSHLTVSGFAAMVVGLIIYPIAIRRLGEETYGLYVFGLALMGYFVDVVAMGLRMPAVKMMVEAGNNRERINRVVSCVAAIRTVMLLFSTLVFVVLILSIDTLRQHSLIYSLAFAQLANIWLMPSNYFQSQQRMQYITYPTVICRALSIPFIYFFVQTPDDIELFLIISTASVWVALVPPLWQFFVCERVRLVRISKQDFVSMFRDGLPFFASGTIGTLREQTIQVVIGMVLGMSELAIYDLANKVVVFPRMLTQNINQAIFPNAVNSSTERVKKILKMEWLIGVGGMLCVVVFGYWVVLLLGGSNMTEAYPIAIILSISILTWLVVGGYIALVFVPNGRYSFVTINQCVAFTSFAIVSALLIFVYCNVYVLAAAVAFSGVAELIFSWFMSRKFIIKRAII